LPEEFELQPPRANTPELSNWGVFGGDDDVGTINYLTHEAVLRGVAAVRLGDRYPLNLPMDLPSDPDTGVPTFKPDAPAYQKVTYRRNAARSGLVVNDDYVGFATQASSQWDALIHVGLEEDGVDGVYYNGVDTSAVGEDGIARRNGIDAVARRGIVGRGVLLDVARFVAGGSGEPLPRDHVITPDETRDCVTSQGLEIQPGDIVCFRTGWTEAYVDADRVGRERLLSTDHESGLPPVPGITADHAEMAHSQRWAAVVADNTGVESLPMHDSAGSAHVRMMRNLGLLFGELFMLRDLAAASAADRRYDFLFVASPLLIPGGIGSPANAIAIR
jgi:kynurenine formamidase